MSDLLVLLINLRYDTPLSRLVDKSFMVPRGEIVELQRCSRQITDLARTAGCPNLIRIEVNTTNYFLSK